MALKWGFGKKAEKEAAPGETPVNGEQPATEGEAPKISGRKRLLLLGNGFPARIWGERLKSAGIEFASSAQMTQEEIANTEFEIILDTQWHEQGELEPHHAPALAEGGLILIPCYTASPTHMASGLEGLAASAIGYTLFDTPASEEPRAPLIELARPMQTGDEPLEKAKAFVAEVGFKAELAGDAPGLVFGRVLACLINEAALALSEGLASGEDIDQAMKLGVNYPKGLLEWADTLGLEFIVDILEGLMAHYEEDRYRPAPLLKHMIAAKRNFHVSTLP